ncbi:conserved hypothetical protein [Trichinella spiralis]|uniref:hypothetical protein n=1 Tax=Trichinella spiralis TaxID=6334 RepID=UPI0001EFD51A|nr:conserved hypothetical protein [Trichinella spiralis]
MAEQEEDAITYIEEIHWRTSQDLSCFDFFKLKIEEANCCLSYGNENMRTNDKEEKSNNMIENFCNPLVMLRLQDENINSIAYLVYLKYDRFDKIYQKFQKKK